MTMTVMMRMIKKVAMVDHPARPTEAPMIVVATN